MVTTAAHLFFTIHFWVIWPMDLKDIASSPGVYSHKRGPWSVYQRPPGQISGSPLAGMSSLQSKDSVKPPKAGCNRGFGELLDKN